MFYGPFKHEMFHSNYRENYFCSCEKREQMFRGHHAPAITAALERHRYDQELLLQLTSLPPAN